jgi:hypothetical protein
MSNDLMITNAQLPAYLQSADVGDIDGLITSGPSITRLSIKGSKFRLRRGDEETMLKLLEMNVVIVAFMPLGGVPAKTFYETKYVEGEDSAPTCMSSDGIRPDAGVASPQSTTTCAVCPKNKWGSRITQDGKEAKACSDTKVLYLLAPTADGIEDEVVQLRVPATSLRSLSKYASTLKSRKFPVNAVITKLSFADTAHPQLEFNFGGWLSAEQFDKVKEISAGDTLAAVLKGEVPVAEAERIQVKSVEEEPAPKAEPKPAPAPAPKPAKAPEPAPSLFSDEDLGEEEEEEEEEEAVELDADGRPWDARIDSSNRKKAKSGRWMRRKGLADADYVKIKRELLGKPAAAEPTPEPVVAPVVEPTPEPAADMDDELDALLADLE